MTAVVKTLSQARPVGKDFHLSTNIPFLDRNNPDAFSTCSQKDFQPLSSKKAEPFRPPTKAQLDHKDLRHIKEYLTEAMVSYHRHPLLQITRTPRWTTLHTNFKMQTDPGEVAFLTTQSQNFQPQPFQPPPTLIRHTKVNKKTQHVEKLPESTNKASFTLHRRCPVVKATAKHLEEGFPTIKGDRRGHSFVSHYNNTFQGAWSTVAKPVEKRRRFLRIHRQTDSGQHSSVTMGDPVKIVERETTHAASFSWPTVCRPAVVKERLKLNLGNISKDLWSSTSREAFCHHKLDPVVVMMRNQNFCSLPKGDTDTRCNKEMMYVTTNRISFSDLNHKERPVHVIGADLMTKSHVQFSPPRLSGLYYTSTAKQHYSKQEGERARPAIQLPSNILSGPEHQFNPSTTKTDYLPLKTCRQTPCPSQQRSNIRFPLADQHFRTSHSEDYTAKPMIFQPPAYSQFSTHFVML
ncbi:uncharacterized protein LOC114561975 isoform X2 [Perca flavescens]|uniref:uncharacterized protein LOC114561975 isoform X2 n=1 Tax=Perca flavescens TaxID=8167 RepID=UPI00106DE074|nr:uncharacterized protein LOC114561975 isoform X2 [Perca flavescens]